MFEAILKKLPFYEKLRQIYRLLFLGIIDKNPFVSHFYPGHYYSALPSSKDLDRYLPRSNFNPESLDGININESYQLHYLTRIKDFCSDIDLPELPEDGWRYYWANGFYSFGDGAVLQGIIRMFSSKNIIEIGSGFSSALMMDINQ
jgi:hypothetical protein